MAKMDTEGMDALIEQMRRLGQDEGPVAEEMIRRGSEIIAEEWKKTAEAHGHRETGAMIASIKADGHPTHMGSFIYQDIYPRGKDKHGVRNAEKAFILHYGRANAPGDYWVDEAEQKAKPAVQAACEEIWERFIASSGQ